MAFRNNPIIKGTVLLTVAGFATRILGFFYRIFLADKLVPQMLGSYQLIFPIFAICATIYGLGIQTAISQLIAKHHENEGDRLLGSVLLPGMILSLLLSLSLFALLQGFSVPIASYVLLAPECAVYLRILSILFPFCGVGACINGYYYGVQNARVPATTQVIEQFSRLVFVFLLLSLCPGSVERNCRIAVWGLVVGEYISAIYNIYEIQKRAKPAFCSARTAKAVLDGSTLHNKQLSDTKKRAKPAFCSTRTAKAVLDGSTSYIRPLLWLTITLTGSKLVIAILHSAESIFIPASLCQYGCSTAEALSIYGILSGMVMPFILFPSSITNAIALMLLPAVASSEGTGENRQITRYIYTSTKYSLLLGFACTLFFLCFGSLLGNLCFHNETAGYFLRCLSWLCPFLYLSTTLTSIINGLGKTKETFVITCISQGVKLFCLIILVPHYGIMAYIHGTLLSQILMTILCYVPLKSYCYKN